ncbi:MAG: hypothetical protein DRP63_04930 [Planctomycetota bacterium]|nr:MAG: hypothetical protein DRP63_04930 [Planctomycetota bacterium]
MRLLPVLVVCLLFVGAGLLADDIVHTKDGKSYRGKIVSRDGKLVRLKTPYGELRIPTSDITAIERELERLKVGRQVFEGEVAKEDEEGVVLKTDFGELRIPKNKIEKREKFVRVEDVKGRERAAVTMDRAQRIRLHQRALQLLHAKAYDEAIKILAEILEVYPHDSTALYNTACAYALKGERDRAVEFLKRSVEEGFTDFDHITHDSDLDSIRNHPGYKDLMAKKEEYMERGARKFLASLKKQLKLGEGYIYEIDRQRKLIFAVYTSKALLERLKKTLTEYAEAQWRDLFDNKPTHYIAVVILRVQDFRRIAKRRVGGFYDPRSHTLIAPDIGGVLIHEFTHALHFGDIAVKRQAHPIWVVEGLATCFESSDLIDGHAVPCHNVRLIALKRAIAAGKTIPLKRLMRLSHRQFMRVAMVAYAESRYVMFYLHKKGLLRKFYKTFCDTYKKDKTGIYALEKVVGKKIEQFEKEWVEWVRNLQWKRERVKKGGPFLGITTSPAAGGLKIYRVLAGSPADNAGLKVDDIILKADGKPVKTHKDLVDMLKKHKPGDVVEMEVLRGEKTEIVKVKLGVRED